MTYKTNFTYKVQSHPFVDAQEPSILEWLGSPGVAFVHRDPSNHLKARKKGNYVKANHVNHVVQRLMATLEIIIYDGTNKPLEYKKNFKGQDNVSTLTL